MYITKAFCDCKGWKYWMPKHDLDSARSFVRGEFNFGFKDNPPARSIFKFCPWCGKQTTIRTEEVSFDKDRLSEPTPIFHEFMELVEKVEREEKWNRIYPEEVGNELDS